MTTAVIRGKSAVKKSPVSARKKKGVRFTCPECDLLREKVTLTEQLLDERTTLWQTKLDDLTNENYALSVELDQWRNKYEDVRQVIVDHRLEPEDIDEPDVNLSHNGVLYMLDRLVTAAHHPPTTETRLTDLETRITQLSSQLASRLRELNIYENFLTDLYHDQPADVAILHSDIADLFISTGKVLRDGIGSKQSESLSLNVNESAAAIARSLSLSTFAVYPEKAEQIVLKPPINRLSGCTPVNRMNRDLRKYICCELDRERSRRSLSVSGVTSYWRILAERIGLSHVIDACSKVQSPTNQLLTEWGRSESATVRLLHRHLSAAHMQCPLLSRRIQEFYIVE